MRHILGVDMSTTCPSFTILRSDYEHIITYAFPKESDVTKKMMKCIKSVDEDLKFIIKPIPSEANKFSEPFERFHYIAYQVFSELENYYFDNGFIEGYSMASKAGRICDIVETTTCFKSMLYDSGIVLTPIPPTTNKKLFTGVGNASKLLMGETFLERTKIPLHTIYGRTSISDKIINDMVDSYSIAWNGVSLMNDNT